MKILVVAEDLRVSGTSEGQVSRAFVYRMANHPDVNKVDLLYLKNEQGDHQVELLPVSEFWQHDILFAKSAFAKFLEKVGHKLFGRSLEEKVKLSKINRLLKRVDFAEYDFIAVRSTGHSFLTLRACKKLSHLKSKVILFFHDPFPVFWDPGFNGTISKRGLHDFLEMRSLVEIGFTCVTPSEFLGRDLRFLYRSKKDFLTLPHQFVPEVFTPAEPSDLKRIPGRITIMYHGAIQLGRIIDPFIDACIEIVEANPIWKDQLSLIFRIKGKDAKRLKKKYSDLSNLSILPQVSSTIALWESKEVADVNLIIEPFGNYSNILVGKAPLLDYVKRRVLILGPQESELRRIILDDRFFALADSTKDIKESLLAIIEEFKENEGFTSPFGDYFSKENFNHLANKVFRINP